MRLNGLLRRRSQCAYRATAHDAAKPRQGPSHTNRDCSSSSTRVVRTQWIEQSEDDVRRGDKAAMSQWYPLRPSARHARHYKVSTSSRRWSSTRSTVWRAVLSQVWTESIDAEFGEAEIISGVRSCPTKNFDFGLCRLVQRRVPQSCTRAQGTYRMDPGLPCTARKPVLKVRQVTQSARFGLCC